MRILFVPQERGGLRLGLLYGSIVLCLIAAARVFPLGALLPTCLFRGITGIACPTCGTTRALLRLARGELFPALSMNPLLVLLMLSLLGWFFLDVLLLLTGIRVPVLRVNRTEGTLLRIAAALIFIGNWIYLILRLS